MNSHIHQFSHTFNLDKIVERERRRELISEVANTVGNDLSNDLQISMSKLAYYSFWAKSTQKLGQKSSEKLRCTDHNRRPIQRCIMHEGMIDR